jgi:hypothetical protein
MRATPLFAAVFVGELRFHTRDGNWPPYTWKRSSNVLVFCRVRDPDEKQATWTLVGWPGKGHSPSMVSTPHLLQTGGSQTESRGMNLGRVCPKQPSERFINVAFF